MNQNDFNTAAGGATPNLWHYWHTLKTKSRLGQWDAVETLLAQNPTARLPYQEFVADVFHSAANQGRLEIVKTLFNRGFSLPEEEGAETLKRLVVFRTEGTLSVAVYLSAHVETKDAFYAIAARGTVQTMQAFQKAGCDILTEGSSFFLAFYAGNADMLHYLGTQGANLYIPSVIAGFYGRQNEMDAQKAPETLSAYKKLLEDDTECYQQYYAYIAPAHPTIDDLRAIPSAVAAEKQTLLSLAIRGGFFEDVLAAAQIKDAPALTANDFLQKDSKGISPLAMLAARGELEKAFDVRLWHKSTQQAVLLHAGLHDFRAENRIDLDKFSADLRLHNLQARAKKGGLRLGSRPAGT